MKNLLLLALVLIGCLAVPQQLDAQKGKLARANSLFEDLNFVEATKVYLEILDKRDNSEAKIKLAECYRKTNNFQEMEYWFGQVVLLPDAQPIHTLYYAMALQANGKCDQAKPQFQRYNSLVPDDQRGRLLAQACDQGVQNELIDAGSLYQVTLVPNINSDYDDFGPAFYQNNLVFASERDKGAAVRRIHAWTGRPFLELFSVKTTLLDEQTFEYNYGTPEKFHPEINTRFHDGPATFTTDFTEIYFTRNNLINGRAGRNAEGIVGLKIFKGRLEKDGKVQDMTGLPFNSDEYDICHPTLSQDGTKMFFAANIPGGFGGMDIYVSYMENGRWAPPANLGPRINTEGNEVFPFTHQDGSLFFASDGQTGLGGLDIYVAKENAGSWTLPQNLGFPINSNKDDFGLIFNPEKTHGYFVSDRDGGVGRDDIYSFTKFAVTVEVLVFDKRTGKPLPNATVTSSCFGDRKFNTGANGRVTLELPLNKSCNFLGMLDKYIDNTVSTTTRGYAAGSTLLVQIPLDQPLEFNVAVTVIEDGNKKGIPNARVTIESDCGQPAQTLSTDANGLVTFALREECSYMVKVTGDGYFTGSGTVTTRGLQQSQNLALSIPLKPYMADKPLKFAIENIYYDFNKWNIREDASTGLYTLLKLLEENPDLIVEVGSHTDARGSKKYNNRLSSRRAESVVRWLVDHNIPKERLTFKGYGESEPVNNCKDNVKCPEEDHQRNRRTEFRVVGTIYGKDFRQGGFKSVEPATIKTDRCNGCPF